MFISLQTLLLFLETVVMFLEALGAVLGGLFEFTHRRNTQNVCHSWDKRQEKKMRKSV